MQYFNAQIYISTSKGISLTAVEMFLIEVTALFDADGGGD
jgi:hypothetical protein